MNTPAKRIQFSGRSINFDNDKNLIKKSRNNTNGYNKQERQRKKLLNSKIRREIGTFKKLYDMNKEYYQKVKIINFVSI